MGAPERGRWGKGESGRQGGIGILGEREIGGCETGRSGERETGGWEAEESGGLGE